MARLWMSSRMDNVLLTFKYTTSKREGIFVRRPNIVVRKDFKQKMLHHTEIITKSSPKKEYYTYYISAL